MFGGVNPAKIQGMMKKLVGLHLPYSKGISEIVLRTGKAVVSASALEDPRFTDYDLFAGQRAVACVPLTNQDHTIGVLGVSRSEAFSTDEVNMDAS